MKEMKDAIEENFRDLYPRLNHLQETAQIIQSTCSKIALPHENYAEEVKERTEQPPRHQTNTIPENSFVITKNKDYTETRDSSWIKTALSKHFLRLKSKHVKTADGRVIVETDSHETAPMW